jgi:carboxynorspermidine decarboxylase
MPAFTELPIETPAFIYDESQLLKTAKLLAQASEISGCKMLYSIKSLPLVPVLQLLSPYLAGFSVSSLFEARLAARCSDSLHITTPGFRATEIGEIGDLCRFVAFNSLQQLNRLQALLGNNASAGLRVNPSLSFLNDSRFDPCREFSKLGMPLDELTRALAEDNALSQRIKGLHFHTVFSARSFAPLRLTIGHIEKSLGGAFLSGLDWINLGGGYLFESLTDLAELMSISEDLRQRFGVEVYFEPGKAFVGRAGYLAASVLDRFRRDGKTILILDSSVHHHPEIFEYQLRPEPAWIEPEHGESAILAGCSCLAGDVFGEYRFAVLPDIGERIVFANVGAYSLVKASRFNGYNLPNVYAWDGAGDMRLMKNPSFEEYAAQWTADARGDEKV